MRHCEHCGSDLDWRYRADTRFCSVRCRVANHRSQCPIPGDLKSLDRWVRHRDKRPLTALGAYASSTDASTWCGYEVASSSHVGDGLGFVLNGDGIVCIDLDHCLNGRRLNAAARDILTSLPATYVEYSPSRTGLHVWGRAQLSRAIVSRGLEVYGDKRYITVTGWPFRRPTSSLGDLSAFIASLSL